MRWQMEFASRGPPRRAVTSFSRSSDDVPCAEGDRGWIDFQQHAFTYRGIKCVTSRGPLNFAPPDQQALQIDDFADCILSGRETPVPGEMGRRDIRILRAIYESAASGRRVLV